jgi:dTDP-4-amino-4,6-dideoxygalactose transaminase
LDATDRAAATVLSLPMHPYLTREDQSRIAAALDRRV